MAAAADSKMPLAFGLAARRAGETGGEAEEGGMSGARVGSGRGADEANESYRGVA